MESISRNSPNYNRKEPLEHGGRINHAGGERERFATSRLTLSTLFNLALSNPNGVSLIHKDYQEENLNPSVTLREIQPINNQD